MKKVLLALILIVLGPACADGFLEYEGWEDEVDATEDRIGDEEDFFRVSSEAVTKFTDADAEIDFLRRINEERTSRGLRTLRVCGEIRGVARRWSQKMRTEDRLYHNPNFGSQIDEWRAVGENVGRGATVGSLHSAFMNSTGHRRNILDSRWTHVGIGVEVRNGRMWVTQNFRQPVSGASCAAAGPARPVIVRDGRWHLRDALLGGSANRSFNYGRATDTPLLGDWNGDGIATPGYRRGNTWYLRNANSAGTHHISFRYGRSTDTPIVGDWNRNGRDTIGVVRGRTWYLRNSNSAGDANIVFNYGRSSDKKIVGDWNGNGRTTIGVVRGNQWLLRNSNSSGSANISFQYGRSTDLPIVGDWNGNGRESAGVVRGNRWYMRGISYNFRYGRSSDHKLIARK